jgi:GGDEF domain-containing protein
VVARLGGDEFVIVLPGVGEPSEARRIADLVAAAIARPLAYIGRELRIGASFGISVCPVDGDNTDALLKIADEDMYRAKLEHRKLLTSAANQRHRRCLRRLAGEIFREIAFESINVCTVRDIQACRFGL